MEVWPASAIVIDAVTIVAVISIRQTNGATQPLL
ncbi:hypothetical protein SAMN02745900_03635 [Pseudomonas sp. URIL14HWK12:I8]|nr:hypothetical protein SAMN02745900_03635 [Pseudomonas sp. URIL14HWK12:I8]